MRTHNHLYENQEGFSAFLLQNGIDRMGRCLVRIYTAICTPEEAVTTAREIRHLLPRAEIFGASGSGVIFNGIQHDTSTLVVIEESSLTDMTVRAFTFRDKTPEAVAQEVAAHLQGNDAALMHVVCADHYADVDSFVRAFNVRNSQVRLVGGIAGDVLPKNILGYVFTDVGVVEQGILTITYSSKTLHLYHRTNISHDPISPLYTITATKGSLLLEIEGRPAVEWCKDQLGLKTMEGYEDWQTIAENDALVRFPFVLEGHGGASRFLRFDPQTQEMSLYFSQVRAGTNFRIGYVSPIKCVSESFSICNEMEQHPVESLFCYTCLFRKLYLQNCADWELRPFAEHGVCGVFMMGEICYINGTNEFLNGSCCLSGIAEDENYIMPDYSVFADLYQIKDDNESLLHFVLQKQSEEMSRENRDLLAKLMQQQTLMQNQLYTDIHTGQPNSIKFLQQEQSLCFNKLCMIVIDNAELLMSHMGKESYYRLFKSISEEIVRYCNQRSGGDSLHFYVQNETILFLAANDRLSEEIFMELVNGLYRQFQGKRLESKTELLINRFVVVLNQNDLLEKAFCTLKTCATLQTDFLLWDSSIEAGSPPEGELDTIYLINQALEKGRLVPVFQGIRDNRTGEITKYEALMRLADAEGRLYAPGEFMEVAKKYHLYSRLSSLMIEKVMSLFAGRSEVVSINLSAFDVNFSTTYHLIFQLLEKLGRADNIVFEIVEDEKFRDLAPLRQFIDRVRKFGVKVAIDDFGRGYSNFMEIAKTQPDYIKIDGSIIQDISVSALHHRVCRSIVFLGKQLNAELVAEFVETEEVQQAVQELGIHYTQGYLFARPLPFAELGLAEISPPLK